ncbi:MAG: hypothetical protein Q8Q33_08970, partial [Chlamydiota bacterium]|nr:hypothetical protein [Chlamydiota bacterium]
YSILRDFDFFPKSALIPTDKAVEHIELSYPLWVKRADFHAMQTDDVCICRHSQELSDILTSLRKRAVKQTFIQEHIEGDLIKFYGIGDKWFKWFYHKDQTLKGYHFDINKLESITKQSAKGLGLEIYGGDIVINQDSKICLIDMNAWPSFALYRKEASQHIACHIIRTHKNQRPIMV